MRLPRIIIVLMAAMLGGFVAMMFFPDPVIHWLGLIPVKVLRRFYLWQLVSYMLLHGGLIHLLFNMLSLYWFGSSLAWGWGEARFLRYFIFCGVGAALLTVALQPGSATPTIGASGAIYGLLYAWARENPNAVVYMYGFFPMRAKHLVIFLFVLEFLLSYTPSPIARFAHLGGFIAGWIYFRLRIGDFGFSIRDWFYEKARRAEENQIRASQEEIDRILEKINARGINSLTPWEKRRLEQASRKEGKE